MFGSFYSHVSQRERIHMQFRRIGFNPWVGKIPWRRERLPTPVFWPGEFHGLYSHGVAKSRKQLSGFHFNGFWVSLLAQVVKNLPAMQETQVQSLGWEHPLEERMATHSSVLVQRIPCTGEPGELWFIGSQRVGHN